VRRNGEKKEAGDWENKKGASEGMGERVWGKMVQSVKCACNENIYIYILKKRVPGRPMESGKVAY
jgi:hypothetical protein